MLRVDNISVSIHPPRVGRDFPAVDLAIGGDDVSIHPPRVGRDAGDAVAADLAKGFQSTLPVWGGTTVI